MSCLVVLWVECVSGLSIPLKPITLYNLFSPSPKKLLTTPLLLLKIQKKENSQTFAYVWE